MFPEYEADGSEILSFENTFRDISPQSVDWGDCFIPEATLAPTDNKLVLNLTAQEFKEIFSALYNGAELTYPDRFLQIVVNFLKGLHCPPVMEDTGGCINYFLYASFVEFLEQNPYSQPDFVPEGYLFPPFVVNTEFTYPEMLGYIATDVMVVPAAIPVFGDWGDLLALHFPTIVLHVVGTGQIEVDFLSVVLGGQVIIKVGSPPNILDIVDGIIETGVKIVDLGQDLTAVPPESDTVIAEEINIDAPMGTDVYFVFVPKLDASTEFFGMGGGIRQIGLCGLEQEAIVGGITNLRWVVSEDVNPFGYGYYQLEQQLAGVWSPVEGSADVGNWLRDMAIRGVDAWSYAYAIRNTEDFTSMITEDYQGWNPSLLKEYIDNAAEDFDPSGLIEQIGIVNEKANEAQAAANDAQAAADAAQATADSAVLVNNSQSIAITNINGTLATHDADIAIAQADILALAAWRDLAQIAIDASSQFQSDMPQPFGQVYNFAADGLPANWEMIIGTEGVGGLSSALSGGNQEVRVNQIDELGYNGQGNVYMIRIACQYTGTVGETVYAGLFGVTPPDTIQQYRVTDQEFDLYCFRFVGNDYLSAGWKVRVLGDHPFIIRAVTLFGWGFPNSI